MEAVATDVYNWNFGVVVASLFVALTLQAAIEMNQPLSAFTCVIVGSTFFMGGVLIAEIAYLMMGWCVAMV